MGHDADSSLFEQAVIALRAVLSRGQFDNNNKKTNRENSKGECDMVLHNYFKKTLKALWNPSTLSPSLWERNMAGIIFIL